MLLFFSLVACSAPVNQSTVENEIPLPGGDATSSGFAQATASSEQTPLPLAGLLNPLTGQAGLDGVVEGQRPVAVTLANNSASLPLRGISGSDVIVEGLNELGSTNILALFGDFRTVPVVGPVADATDPFLQLALPSNAILVHTGVSTYARNLLQVLSYQDVNGTYVGTTGFHYDSTRATDAGGNRYNENCWYTDANLVWNAAGAMGINPIGEVRMLFNFAQSDLPEGEEALDIYFSFNAATSTAVHYDETIGLYTKTAYGSIQTDELTGTPLLFENVFLLFGAVGKKADSPYLEYDFSSGEGYYFQGGRVTPLRWQKGSPTDALRFYDTDGQELEIQQGKSYIAFAPQEQRDGMYYLNAAERAQARAEAEAAAAEAAAAEAAAASAA